jgi:hypothetical protein
MNKDATKLFLDALLFVAFFKFRHCCKAIDNFIFMATGVESRFDYFIYHRNE